MLGYYGLRTNGLAMMNLRKVYEIYPAEPRATMPIGIRVDNWLYGSVSGIDPLTGRFEGDTPAQTRAAVAAMKHVLVSGDMQTVTSRHNAMKVEVHRKECRVGD
jgi:hypothetical protein